MTLVTRAGKGSALTWAEMDGNVTDLAAGSSARDFAVKGLNVAAQEFSSGVGDLVKWNSDGESIYREGTWPNTYGALYAAAGNNEIEFYQSHNVALDGVTGDFLAKDNPADPVAIFIITEAGAFMMIWSTDVDGGGKPINWTIVFVIDSSGFNGAIGGSTRHPVTASAGNFNNGVVVSGATLDLPTFNTSVKNTLTATGGSMVYDTTVGRPSFHNGSAWVNL